MAGGQRTVMNWRRRGVLLEIVSEEPEVEDMGRNDFLHFKIIDEVCYNKYTLFYYGSRHISP
jgi:hypothetical protein